MRKFFSVIAIAALASPLFAANIQAQSVIVHDGEGRISSVVRQGPSGPIVYDRDGRIVRAVRNGRNGVGLIIDDRGRGVVSLGSGLVGGVSEVP